MIFSIGKAEALGYHASLAFVVTCLAIFIEHA